MRSSDTEVEPKTKTGNSGLRICRFLPCSLSVYVAATPAPVACPYCQRSLSVHDADRPLAPEAPVPTLAEVKERLYKLYHQPPKVAVFLIGSVAVFLLAWAVFLQLRNAENYWYQPMVSIYSLLAGLFVVSRFIIAAFYVPQPNVGYEPTITVLVPCMNEEAVVRQTIERVFSSGYPAGKLEVVCVNDGSKDNTLNEMLAAQTRHITTENRGLSSARNTGMREAKGEIVAYIDDDAWPDPHWLTYLAATFLRTSHVGVGGPNIPPPDDGPIAHCVANAPGGPIHVLLTDQEAEHIPGCNMAFRKDALEAVGGFDHTFRIAGDDVDLCWRLQERGWTLGFSAAAMVWHRRRNSVKTYLKQQKNYGKAEAYLEKKWPEKYNAAGHIPWAGRLYFKGFEQLLGSLRGRVYQGTWGSALFQSIYQPAPNLLASLPMMPEWYVVVAALTGVSLLGIEWKPLLLALPVLLAAALLPGIHAVMCGMRATFPDSIGSRRELLKLRALTALLHMFQPLVRLYGRVRLGLTPWRQCPVTGVSTPLPLPRTFTVWSEEWKSPISWLESLESGLKALRAVVLRGGDYDRWDLELRGGLLGSIRVLMAIEEHGGGKQFIRVKSWPRCTPAGIFITLLFAGLGAAAAAAQAWMACGVLNGIAIAFMIWILIECSSAMATMVSVFREKSE